MSGDSIYKYFTIKLVGMTHLIDLDAVICRFNL